VGGDDLPAPSTSLTYAPAYYLMHGRAQGLAAALGDGTITPELVLLALLWDGGTASSQLLWRLGASRERLVERLGRLGVPVPASALPAQHEREWGEPVWFDRDQVRTVLDHVRLHTPPGTRWGFNYEGDQAWIHGQADVDFEALVADALPPAVEVRRIDHVQLAMPAGREDEAEAFYSGLLGLARVPKPPPLSPLGAWFEHGDVHLHLGVEDGFRAARKAHPALLFRGLAPLVERLRAAGVAVAEGERLDAERRVYVDDPFGNRVELLERGGTLAGPP
jgi:catechol 2,3-dioxygenase-like lactoylglutathione lyase family enzyme